MFYIVWIAWLYVLLMIAVTGSSWIASALLMLIFGVLPMGLWMHWRLRRLRVARERATPLPVESHAMAAEQPDSTAD